MQTIPGSHPEDRPLRAMRKALGRSLRSVATEAGVDPAHLSRVERGKSQLTVDLLYHLAQALEMNELARNLRPFTKQREADG